MDCIDRDRVLFLGTLDLYTIWGQEVLFLVMNQGRLLILLWTSRGMNWFYYPDVVRKNKIHESIWKQYIDRPAAVIMAR